MPGRPKDHLSWWERFPRLLERELDTFGRHGATFQEVTRRSDLLILEVTWPRDGADDLLLRVGFSPLHPFCRPSVSAPGLDLNRHQHPITKGLCLITQESGQWDPSQPVADFIAEQLPQVLEAVAHRAAGRWEEAAALEENTPDAISAYLGADPEDHSVIHFKIDQPVPKDRMGLADIIAHARFAESPAFEAILQSAKPLKGPWLAGRFLIPHAGTGWSSVPARWIRMQPPATTDANVLLAAAEEVAANAAALDRRSHEAWCAIAKADISITAIRLCEEVEYGADGMGEGWLFVVARRDHKRRVTASVVRGAGIPNDLQVRVPSAGALRDKKVLLIGCGAIGSFVACELARAGVGGLTLFDKDVLEPGNSVRWPLGRSHWGLSKVLSLQLHLSREYPWTLVTPIRGTIGGSTTDENEIKEADEGPVAVLEGLIRAADVVIDATASDECWYALAFLCREADKPLAIGYATEGAAGGVVIAIPGRAAFCLSCLSRHWKDGTLPQPAVDPTGTVLPIGCNQPTFTGGGYDLQEVSLQVVRTVLSLVDDDDHDRDWDMAVLSHRVGKRRVLPHWTGQRLERHAECACEPRV